MATVKTDLNPQGVSHAGIQSHDWSGPVTTSGQSVTSGTMTVEPRPTERPQQPWSGPECPNPDCGDTRTPVRTSGRDVEERVLRERECENCGTIFTTIEQVVLFTGGDKSSEPVPFTLVDVERRRRRRENWRRRTGWKGRSNNRLRKREVAITGQPRVDARRA